MPDRPPVARMRRHDLVWLDPAFPVSRLGVAEPWRAVMAGWIGRRLPLVVGRQRSGNEGPRLGATLPGTGPRQRIEVHAPLAAVVAHDAAPELESVVHAAPAKWRAELQEAARCLRAAGLVPRVYGSLLNQACTGEACVRPDSDVDLLIDCDSGDAARAAMAILTALDGGVPRLDGELRLHGSHAVAWRELSAARPGSQVLAKSDSDVRLVHAGDLLDPAFPLAAPGRPGHAH